MLKEILEMIPDELIAKRKAKGWTQKKLGQALGVPEQSVQRYEAIRYSSTSLKKLILIASVLESRDSQNNRSIPIILAAFISRSF